MFNNKNVAMCYAPALAYEALELTKAWARRRREKLPIGHGHISSPDQSSKFGPDYANASRKWAADNFNGCRL